ncbi:isoleucine--tRNA ligase, cytoplasmic-like [Aotus nancymaae]|uniref:isoleucine--tRNA ligase, cytoplasmic-like n=1 Tax=Aotus nancymaae TaxID=37293 RepID=UPI0030FE12F4
MNHRRLKAPYTPFLTELMYQNLKVLIDPVSVQDKDTLSIYYLMLPRVREELIDKKTESAISQIQSVIELEPVIRDRKTIPIKYPLKEIVVIHQDPEALKDIKSLEKYVIESLTVTQAGVQWCITTTSTSQVQAILLPQPPEYLGLQALLPYPADELNVRKVTLSADKKKYGIRLRAEPDHMVLGKHLKGAFKAVMTSIKQLSNEELEQFQKTDTDFLESSDPKTI